MGKSAGANFAAGQVEGNLVVHVLQGQKTRSEFEAELALLVERLESSEEIGRIADTGPRINFHAADSTGPPIAG